MSSVFDESAIIMRLHEIAIRELFRLKNEFPEYIQQLDMVHFEWSRNMTRAAGNARAYTGRIRFSVKIWTDVGNQIGVDEKFRNTALHEIAHVMTPGQKHNEKWRSVARMIGCDGERFHELVTPQRKRPKRNHLWTCFVCGKDILLGPGQYRMAKYEGRTYRHSNCKENGHG